MSDRDISDPHDFPDQAFWKKDLTTLLTEPNPKYTVETVMPLL